MNAAIRKVVIAIGATCGVAVLSHAGDGVTLPCPKETLPEVCAAVQIEDQERRTEELHRTLAGALRSENEEVRGQAYRFVSDRISVSPLSDDVQVDPLLLEDALVDFDALETAQARREHAKADPDDADRIVRHAGQTLLDKVGLERAPKPERLRVYERAIIDGEVAFGKVSRLTRDPAIILAVRDGLAELEGIIAVRCPALSEQEQEYVGGCEYVATALQLRAGGEDALDGAFRAARRLAGMPVDELYAKLRVSAGWRRVVAGAASSVCVVGSLEDCLGLKPMFEGLQARWRREHAGSGQSVPAATPTPDYETFRKEMGEVFQGLMEVEGRLHREKVAAERKGGK